MYIISYIGDFRELGCCNVMTRNRMGELDIQHLMLINYEIKFNDRGLKDAR